LVRSRTMTTVHQIERRWEAKCYAKLFDELLAARPEGGLRLGIDTTRPIPAAALAIIRLDELSQSHVKLYSKLVKHIVWAQESDGGWGDLATTALCMRALFCGNGEGVAIDRGLKYLAELQKTEGIWPNVPVRRMPADPYVSALLHYQLGGDPRFRQAIRLSEAIGWFTSNNPIGLDKEARALWERARIRRRLHNTGLLPSLC
jgi:hypothetical protein